MFRSFSAERPLFQLYIGKGIAFNIKKVYSEKGYESYLQGQGQDFQCQPNMVK
jgi:hypothetical protein